MNKALVICLISGKYTLYDLSTSKTLLSSKTSFVLAGANMGPAKLEKAGKLGIPILSEEEFLKKIES